MTILPDDSSAALRVGDAPVTGAGTQAGIADVRRAVAPRLMRAFSFQSADLGLRVLQQLIVVPVLIAAWGTGVYEDWIVIFSAVNFLAILDFGMQPYFGNLLLIAHAQGRPEAFRRHVMVAMTVYAAAVAAGAAILLVLTLWFSWPTLLGVNHVRAAAANWTAVLLGDYVLAMIPAGILTGIYRARGDFDRSVATQIFIQTLSGYGLCVVALGGGPPVAAAAAYVLVAMMAWVALALDQRRRYGEFPLRAVSPTGAELRDAAKRSLQYMAPAAAAPVVFNAPVMMLGIWALPGVVITYTVTRTLTGFIRLIGQQPNLPVGVEMARCHALGDLGSVRTIFQNATQLTAGISGLLGGFLLVMAAPIIRIWTHGMVAVDPGLVQVMVGVITLVAPAHVATGLFQNINRPKILVTANVGFAATGVALALLLVGRFGATGAAFAMGCGELIFFGLLLPIAACRLISMPIGAYARNCLLVMAGSFALGSVAAWALQRVIKTENLLGLIEVTVCWAALIGTPAYFFVLTPRARHYLQTRAIWRRLPFR